MSLINCNPVSYPRGIVKRTDCIEQYNSGVVKLPESGHTLAPWVAIDFVDQNRQGGYSAITVSNRSSDATDPKHCAVIKSFTLGHSDGTDCRVTIHDTQGGAFEEFMKHLIKDWYCLKNANPATLLMKVQFGWVKSGCPNDIPKSKSPCYYVIVDNVEANFAEGKQIFELTGRDNCHHMPEGATQKNKGGPGDKAMHLLDALNEMLCFSEPPNVGSVIFKIITGPGSELVSGRDEIFDSPTNDPDEKKKGPKMVWNSQARNKLDCARAWVGKSLSINKKPWIARYNSNSERGEITFWESSKVECENEDNSYWDKYNLGTYIVNGSRSSPVLEFNPKVKWDFGALSPGAGGNVSDVATNAMRTEGSKNPGSECPSLSAQNTEGAGQVTGTEPSEGEIDLHGADATLESAKRDTKNKKALRISYNTAIAADLIIVGDPTFCPPFYAMHVHVVSIVLINPYYIAAAAGGTCGDWLAKPVCNPIFSNRSWRILGVSHTIEAGKYSTRLNVELQVPGVDHKTPKDGGKLGAWNGGWKPPTC
jgi:hypothetical protein